MQWAMGGRERGDSEVPLCARVGGGGGGGGGGVGGRRCLQHVDGATLDGDAQHRLGCLACQTFIKVGAAVERVGQREGKGGGGGPAGARRSGVGATPGYPPAVSARGPTTGQCISSASQRSTSSEPLTAA
eukprot:6663647-Prymnesium_polylepis.2